MPAFGYDKPRPPLERELLQQLRQHTSASLLLPTLARWLADTVDGHVTLTDRSGRRLTQSSHQAREVLARAAREISRVGAGEIHSAVLDENDLTVRVVAVGPHAPHAALAAARTDTFTARQAEAMVLAADVMSFLVPAAEAEDAWSDFHEASARVRSSIFQLLMSGQVATARRTAAGIAPEALDETLRLYLVNCNSDNRTRTARAIETAIHGGSVRTPPHGIPTTRRPPIVRGALVVPCPAYDHHLIVLAPAEADHVTAALNRVVQNREPLEMGVSEATHIALTTQAYRNAQHALNLARRRPERVACYNDRAEVVEVLGDEAYRWAESFIQPLLHAPHVEQDQLFASLRVWLDHPVAESADILNVHRNTVAGRIKRAADLLRLDLGDLRARAALRLALQLDAKAPEPALDRRSHGAAYLESALARPPVRAWAEATLAPLDQDRRGLRGTLRAWISHNADATAVADQLGMHAQTVRSHLRRVGELLDRDLLASGAGTHDLVIALSALREIPALPGSVPPLSPGFLARILSEPSGIDTLPEGGPEAVDD